MLRSPFVLNNNIDDFIIDSMKKLVWHRLTDIDVFYNQVLGIKFNLSRKFLSVIETRHDIVHRNSFDLDGNKITIEKQKFRADVYMVYRFITEIDLKYSQTES